MIQILNTYQASTVHLNWKILKGSSQIPEDFSRATLSLLLVTPSGVYQTGTHALPNDKIHLQNVTADHTGIINATVPTELPTGIYSLKAIWVKDQYKYGLAEYKNAFAITDDPAQETPWAGTQLTIRIVSTAATYGYDGLNAYELALLDQVTTALSEKEYVQIRASEIETNQIADEAITTPKIADEAVTTPKIADDAVTTHKIPNNAVTTEKILNAAVTTGKINDNAVTTDKIADRAVTTTKIIQNAVTTDKIADEAVTTAKIKDENVTTPKIADGAVTTPKIPDLNITTDKIADSAVTTAKIPESAITTPKIINNAVTTDKINNDAVTTDKIADANITTAKINDAAVTTPKIQDEAVTTAKIADLNVTTPKIANSNVTTPKIADGAVTRDKIADGAITELTSLYDTFQQQIAALAASPKLTATANPNILHNNTQTQVTIGGNITKVTPASMAVANNATPDTHIYENTGSATISTTQQVTLDDSTPTITYRIKAIYNGMTFFETVTLQKRNPIYYGFAANAAALAASASNRYTPTASAAHTYEKTSTTDGQHFYVLIPTDITTSTPTFTMGGAPLVMNKTVGVVTKDDGTTANYNIYTSGNTYNNNTTIKATASL